MNRRVDFNINESLKLYLSDAATIPTPEAHSALLNCEDDPESLTPGLINSVLNPIVEAIVENPEAICDSANFDSLQFLLKCAPVSSVPSQRFLNEPSSELFKLSRSTSILPNTSLSKVLDLVVSALSALAENASTEHETEEVEVVQTQKQLLEMYGFLLQWAICITETKAAEKSATATPARGRGAGRGSKAKATGRDGAWDSSVQVQAAMDAMCKVLRLRLSNIFVATSERDTFVGLFTRSVYLIIESEQRIKSTTIRMHAFKVLCIAIKHHGHAYGAQTSILQNLSYFEHLSEPMAEFLHILAEQYDYPQLTDEVLRELSSKEFNSNDTKGPKSVSSFLVKLSELVPRLVMKEVTLLAKQLDSEAYTLRCAIIEVCGNLITDLSKQEERNENNKNQISGFFDILEERFLDVNPYCRSRVLQVFIKLCDLEQKFPKRRQIVTELASQSLGDKSSNVRRNAIKLLGKLVSTHPFGGMHGGLLSQRDWKDRLQAVEAEINALRPPQDSGLDEKAERRHDKVDETLLDDATILEGQEKTPELTEEQKEKAMEKAAEEVATSEMMTRLQLTQKYYTEAVKFIEVLHKSSMTVCQLLSSKNKSEIIEAMDFFVILDAYKVEAARAGIRRMLRLIWTKGNSDEGKGVQTHLVDCYKGLFFDAPEGFSENDSANYIARNMISLTFGATPAEMTSLEQLLSSMMKAGHVSELVVTKLWQVYGVQQREISRNQRRGAIAVLGMLALADNEMVVREMETLLRVGLGPLGRADLGLARYTCIALKRINPSGRQAKESKAAAVKLADDHPILLRLAAMTDMQSISKEWYGVAEQAVTAIYKLAKHPDNVCSDILKRKTTYVFQSRAPKAPSVEPGMEVEGDVGSAVPPLSQPEKRDGLPKSSAILAQLLFLVGHIAIQQIVYLEISEQVFKRRKADKEKSKSSGEPAKKGSSAAEADELDLIGGTSEDDFTEAMAHIREKELLFGERSLLSTFGPLVAEVCSNNLRYNDQDLQATATLCMAKLMCVSSTYCEQNLPLLITILERSEDPITRNNVVIALGDIAVCFNHLIDENTDFLYRRLNDQDSSVKRTCLMTLTFLILAGQVKVKGQLGEMAKCLEDQDKKIADLSKMFFTELATKDNAVYNQFVDMFSVLTTDKGLEEESLKRIVKFLASFVEKDKHAKQLAEKLAARFSRCDTERQWNDIAYALSLLQHKNEAIQKTVAAGFKVVQANA